MHKSYNAAHKSGFVSKHKEAKWLKKSFYTHINASDISHRVMSSINHKSAPLTLSTLVDLNLLAYT